MVEQDLQNARAAKHLGSWLGTAARSARGSGDARESDRLYREAVAVLLPFVERGDAENEIVAALVCALLPLGRIEEARPHVDRLVAAKQHLDPERGHPRWLLEKHGLLPTGD